MIQKNEKILTKFEFLSDLNLKKQTTIAIIGDFIHTDVFSDIVKDNEYDIPNNDLDDDLNGFIDDYQGFNFHSGNGRLSTPYMYGHENSIASLLDTVIKNFEIQDKIKILPINVNVPKPVFDELKIKKIADAIDYARLRGVDVISMSLGISISYQSFFRFIDNDVKKSFHYYESAVHRARDAGIIMLAASSNDTNLNHMIEKDIPSSSPGVFSISNVDFQGNLKAAYGLNVDTAFYGSDLYLWGGDKEGYARRTGSSYATPLVALTIAAAISEKNGPIGDEDSTRKLLRKSCEKHLVGKKQVASKCIFSPRKFVENIKRTP